MTYDKEFKEEALRLWTIVNKVDRKNRKKLKKKLLGLVGRKAVIVRMRSDGIVKSEDVFEKAIV